MHAKFTTQTKLFVIMILLISPSIIKYLFLRYSSTPVKYITTNCVRDLNVNNSGKKYREAEEESFSQNESAIIADRNKKRQTDLINKANTYLAVLKPHPVNTELFSFTRNNRENMELLDIMGLPPIKFDPAYKNPCFIGDRTNQLFNDGKLHCLPYFYIIGVKKSGTSDLYNRISTHPEFKSPGFKEAQWFPRLRFGYSVSVFYRKTIFKRALYKGKDNRSIKFYISLFDMATYLIQSCSTKNERGGVYHNYITADGTPGNLHMHTNWDLLHGNEGLVEPRYTNFDYIKHITPDAKIIIIFRNPVTRLFSDFKHELRMGNHTVSTDISRDFHANVTVMIQAYESCFRQFSMRRCIYNDTLLEKERVLLKDSFRAGFYAFYWEELLSVFSRDQILPIHMTRYMKYTGETLANTFTFLNMSPLSRKELSEISKSKVSNKTPIKGQMNQETKDMLYKFYKPYNKIMAEMMNDSAYLFLQS